MNFKRFHYAMIAGLFLSILLFVILAYELDGYTFSQANQASSLKAKLTGLTQEQTSLLIDKNEIKKYQNLYNIAQGIVPENKDQVQAVRQIVNLAAAYNVTIGSITFPTSTLGNAPSTGGVLPKNISQSQVNASTNDLSQLTPVASIPGVYELPITVQSSTQLSQEVTFSEFINFLSALEQNRLTALVSSINITPDSTNPNYFSFSLQINIYVKPGV